MFLCVAIESERNRALRHKARGAPVRSAWLRKKRNLVGHIARPPSKRLVDQRNKADVYSSENVGVLGSFALLGGGDGVTRGACRGGQDGSQQLGIHTVCDNSAIVANWERRRLSDGPGGGDGVRRGSR
jgi:hypothetical protein